MYSQVALSLLFSQQVSADTKGYYMQSWEGASAGPDDTNIGVYFSGHNDVDTALDEMPADTIKTLRGDDDDNRKVWFSFGGGYETGELDLKNVRAFLDKIKLIKEKGFDGVMWDIELVKGSCAKDTSQSLRRAFRVAFHYVKQAGLGNGITVSHTAPIHTDTPQDATDLMEALLIDPNVDLISPQLYSDGLETEPKFDETWHCKKVGCGWDLYKDMRSGMKLVPSIVESSHYKAAKKELKSKGLKECSGYFVWKQSNRRLHETILV